MAKYDNDSEFDDLMGVDLNALDLEDIDLGLEVRAGPNLFLQGVLYIGLAGLVLWLPSTSYYHSSSTGGWMFFVVCGGAVFLGLFGGRWLTAVFTRAAERWARRQEKKPEVDLNRPPSAVARWFTLLSTLGGIIAIILGSSYQNTSGAGFWIAIGAVAVGLNLGRWLLMQQHRPFKQQAKALKMPPWMKWVSLGVMVAAGLIVLFSGALFGQGVSKSLEFSFGALAFVVAIGAAIWLAKRFDEAEKRLRAKHQRRPRV